VDPREKNDFLMACAGDFGKKENRLEAFSCRPIEVIEKGGVWKIKGNAACANNLVRAKTQ